MRCFFSINLPENVRDQVSGFVSGLKRSEPNLSWVPALNLHITLKFLGNLSDEKVSRLITYCNSVRLPGFSARFHGLGVFPHPSHARVLWLGLDRGGRELSSLFKLLDDRSYLVGVEKESKPYVPHMTLARCRHGISNRKILLKGFESSVFNVGGFSLMESVFSDNGVSYREVHSFNL